MSDWPAINTALTAGEVVILPTETVYGLATRANSGPAISKLYAIKGRDFDKPLAVCVRDAVQGETLAVFNDTARHLAEQYWPGPLTLVLDAQKTINLDPRALGEIDGRKTIALRCPDVSWRKHLTAPLALTSANRSGEADSVTFADAMASVGTDIGAALAHHEDLSGVPTTILRVTETGLAILRQGAVEVSV